MSEHGEQVPSFNPEGGFAEVKRPIEYSIPFEWGTFQVTEKAHRNYGLIPLIPTNGPLAEAPSAPDLPFTTTVTLIAGEELEGNDIPSGAFGAASQIRKKSIDTILVVGGNIDSLINTMINNSSVIISNLSGEEAEPNDIFTEEGISLPDVIRQDFPQVIAHSIVKEAINPLSDSVHQWLSMEANKKSLRSVTALGATGLIGGGVLAGAFVALNGSHAGAESVIIPLAYTSTYLFAARERLKRHLFSTTARGELAELAHLQALEVVNDIHKAYCRKHFDDKANDFFNPTES